MSMQFMRRKIPKKGAETSNNQGKNKRHLQGMSRYNSWAGIGKNQLNELQMIMQKETIWQKR
jgi:hypothetical protein